MGDAVDGASHFNKVFAVLETQPASSRSVEPSMPALEALELLLDEGLFQVPIVSGTSVLGVFSLRAVAEALLPGGALSSGNQVSALTVAEFREEPVWTRREEEVSAVVRALEDQTDLLIGTEGRFEGSLSAASVLQHLNVVARPFSLIGEIELGLRRLIAELTDNESFRTCAQRSLSHKYGGDPESVPSSLTDMTFAEEVSLIEHGDNFREFFASTLGSRDHFRSMLASVPPLRNDVFHFRRSISDSELGHLLRVRNWLRTKELSLTADLLDADLENEARDD